MIWLWTLWLATAQAGGIRVVHAGDTLESIAAELGDPTLAEAFRAHLELPEGGQPAVGTVVEIPDGRGGSDCRPSYVLDQEGSGVIRLPAGDEVALRPFTVLPLGSQVCTGDDGFAQIRIAAAFGRDDHDTLTLLPDTCLTIRATHIAGGRRSTHVTLEQGAISVSEVEDPGQVLVETEAGVTLGEAGGFRVAVEPEATRTEAVAGDAATFAQGVQVDVPEGFGGRTRVGEAPGAPVALLKPGALIKPQEAQVLKVPDFAWAPVDDAFGYVIEVASEPTFGALVLRQRVPEPRFAPPRLLLPARTVGVWWRIVVFDALGFEGIPSESRWVRLPDGVLR